MGTNLDVLVIDNYLLLKSDQDENKKLDYKKEFK